MIAIQSAPADERLTLMKKFLSVKKNRIIFTVLCVTIAAAALAAGFLGYRSSLVYPVCRVEAGVRVTPADVLKKADPEAYFTEDSDRFDTAVPGEYLLKIRTGIFNVTSRLIVSDTIAPEILVRDVDMHMGDSCGADVFFVSVEDATATELYFDTQPDFTKAGEQQLKVAAKDAGGNVSSADVKLFITQIIPEYEINAGEPLPDCSVFAQAAKSCCYAEDVDFEGVMLSGEYFLGLEADGRSYRVRLNVRDTEPPVLTVKNAQAFQCCAIPAESFVDTLEDTEEVSVSYKETPDFSVLGDTAVTIIATDRSGNSSEASAVLTVVEDNEPPVFFGVKALLGYIGDTVLYRSGISVSDNSGAEIEFEVDKSAVDESREGSYEVIYSAADPAGNVTEAKAVLTMVKLEFTQETVNELCDAVLSGIITAGMDDIERTYAIYKYVYSHITYIDKDQMVDPIKAVCESLRKRTGSCYAFAQITAALLTRTGITNTVVERDTSMTGGATHFWNLVDYGSGWYIVDSCPRKDKPEVFLWNGELADMYTKYDSVNTFLYDKNVYPSPVMYGDAYTDYYGEGVRHPAFIPGTRLEKKWAAQGIYPYGYSIPGVTLTAEDAPVKPVKHDSDDRADEDAQEAEAENEETADGAEDETEAGADDDAEEDIEDGDIGTEAEEESEDDGEDAQDETGSEEEDGDRSSEESEDGQEESADTEAPDEDSQADGEGNQEDSGDVPVESEEPEEQDEEPEATPILLPIILP